MINDRIRVLLAQPGLDGRDRSADIIARALLGAGIEVIYNRLRQTPEMIAQAASQHDVHLVQLSILSGDHIKLVQGVREALDRVGLRAVSLVVGGIIPESDQAVLKDNGANAVMSADTHIEEIVNLIQMLAKPDIHSN